jgi:uncharacterized protein YceH (UPF0502 family)
VDIRLTPYEARVIGCLLEKHRTTPEHYPLSLNALTNACNQKSSRDPMLALDEATVQDTVDTLMKKHYVVEKSGFSSRVTKYQHRFCNSEFGALQFSGQELGIVCVLLLRGPQTPGELRTRTERLCKFQDTREVESTLIHNETETHEAAAPDDAVSAGPDTDADRMEQLEQLVNQLRDEMATLKARLDRISPEQDAGSMP